MKFEELELDERILSFIEDELEFRRPTKIQEVAIPEIMNRKNVIGVAPTGSGKTFAFLFPVLHMVLHAKVPHNDPVVLILLPTRELAIQTSDVLKEINKFLQIKHSLIYTGTNLNRVRRELDEMVDIIVATPGQLINFIDEDQVNLNRINALIIDEVDRMLDMGFQGEIERILQHLSHRNERQTLVFGATLNQASEDLARMIMVNPTLVDVGRSTFPRTLRHEIYEAYEDEKLDILMDILKTGDIMACIIFVKTRIKARVISKKLLQSGLELEEIHSELTQKQRNIAMDNFSNGVVNVLLSTDLAARGIDIADVSHVINFDVPNDINDYIHRAGRTARAFKRGTSILLASPQEANSVRMIEEKAGKKIERMRKVKGFDKHIKQRKRQSKSYKKKYGKRTSGQGYRKRGRKSKRKR